MAVLVDVIVDRGMDGNESLPPWRDHDLRRTAASGIAALGTPPHVVEKTDLLDDGGAFPPVDAPVNSGEAFPPPEDTGDRMPPPDAAPTGDVTDQPLEPPGDPA
jgi:hypothetical protein